MASYSPNQVDILSTIHCCFNWDFMNMNKEQKTELWLQDRIATIEGELNAQSEDSPKRNFPQLYSLQGFLYTQLYLKKESNGAEYLQKAEKAFQNALDACEKESCGYRAIAYGNLIYFNHKKWSKNKSEDPQYQTQQIQCEYNEIKKITNIPKNPEVLAMQGYSANYFRMHNESINFYQEALKSKETAEWVFGLALVKLHGSAGMERTRQENDEIETLLRHAVELDPTYHFVGLKLARHLLKQRKPHGTEEVVAILEQVPLDKDKQRNIIVLEEAAGLYTDIGRDDKALELYNIAETINPSSMKTLRGLGNIYQQKWVNSCWKKKGAPRRLDEASLKNAVKYFTENVDSDNAKPFDITKIANIHLRAYKTFNEEASKKGGKQAEKNLYRNKADHHKKECTFWYKKAEERLNKNQFDLRSEIEVCYRLSEYYREFDSEEVEKYLEETFRKASLGTDQDNFYELKFVKNAREELLQLASKEKGDQVKVLKTKAWIYELSGHYESALFYLQKVKISSNTDALQERELSLYFKIIKNKRRIGLDVQKIKKEMDQLIPKISDFHNKKEFELKSRIIEIETKFSDDNITELKENFIQFEKMIIESKFTATELADKIVSIFHDSKVVLERTMKYIKENLYHPEGKDILYYPNQKVSQTKEDLKKFFEKDCKWEDFSTRYTQMFLFFVEKLNPNDYSYVGDYVKVRNKGEHDLKKVQLQLLDQKCPTKQDKIELTRKSAFYSAEVFNFIKKEVDGIL
ncbi:uncharacterized protein [Clytia hemisphaerica]|uniref:Uncharacterized protein n=1 Tax=Clytia hemisphaerica TaxID=252671 RepID=A0A7M5X0S3_9CNID